MPTNGLEQAPMGPVGLQLVDGVAQAGHCTDAEIDAISDDLLKSLYQAEISVQDLVDTLREFSTAEAGLRMQVFTRTVENLLAERDNFHLFPEQELSLTAELLGQMLCCNLLQAQPLRDTLRCVIASLRSPPDSKMFRFGQKALAQFELRLSNCPELLDELRRPRPSTVTGVAAGQIPSSTDCGELLRPAVGSPWATVRSPDGASTLLLRAMLPQPIWVATPWPFVTPITKAYSSGGLGARVAQRTRAVLCPTVGANRQARGSQPARLQPPATFTPPSGARLKDGRSRRNTVEEGASKAPDAGGREPREVHGRCDGHEKYRSGAGKAHVDGVCEVTLPSGQYTHKTLSSRGVHAGRRGAASTWACGYAPPAAFVAVEWDSLHLVLAEEDVQVLVKPCRELKCGRAEDAEGLVQLLAVVR